MLSASEVPDVIKNNSQNPSVFMNCYKKTLFKRLGDLFHMLYLDMQNEEKLNWKSWDEVP